MDGSTQYNVHMYVRCTYGWSDSSSVLFIAPGPHGLPLLEGQQSSTSIHPSILHPSSPSQLPPLQTGKTKKSNRHTGWRTGKRATNTHASEDFQDAPKDPGSIHASWRMAIGRCHGMRQSSPGLPGEMSSPSLPVLVLFLAAPVDSLCSGRARTIGCGNAIPSPGNPLAPN